MPRTEAEKTKHLQAEIAAVLTNTGGSALQRTYRARQQSRKFQRVWRGPRVGVLYAIYNDIAANGENSPFLRLAEEFSCCGVNMQAAIAALDVKLTEAEGPERVAGVKGFGMYWHGDPVHGKAMRSCWDSSSPMHRQSTSAANTGCICSTNRARGSLYRSYH